MPARSRFSPVKEPQKTERTESSARSFWLANDLSGTSDETSSSGGNKTNLMTTGSISSDCRRMTNMLMVTTTVRMLDGVHSNTSNSRPMRSLCLHLEVHSVGFKERFVSSLTTSGDTNHSSAVSLDLLSVSRWQFNTSFSTVIDVTNNGGRGAGSSGKRSSVSELSLTIGDDGTFRHEFDGKNISNREGSLNSRIDKLTGEHSFDCDEVLDSLLESVRISESDLGKWGTTTGVVDDVLDNTLEVSKLL